MCGLVAISNRGAKAPAIDAALRAIAHRGPDDRGVYSSSGNDCVLGHVRLSILDLSSAGHQPMADRSGRFTIVYNGEVYNYRELQAELTQRHGPVQWSSGTDTEVIVEGFAREGRDFLARLNGIFALAIYDSAERILHVLRDPLGVKPLFVSRQKGRTCFCSEISGLAALPGAQLTLRRESLADQLAFMYVPEPFTPYNEVLKVEPGVLFSYRDAELIDRFAYDWGFEGSGLLESEDEAVEKLRFVLAKSVERQLMSDVPVSLFLSGGLDSSIIAYNAVQAGATIADAYTMASSDTDRASDQQSNDLHYAKLVASRLGLKLTVIDAEEHLLDLLPDLVRFMEDGFSDPAAINTYTIAKAARERGVKVMLSGQGADEFLGGYRRYQLEKFLHRLPAPFLGPLSKLSGLIAFCAPARMNATKRRLQRLTSVTAEKSTERLLAMWTWTRPHTIDSLLVEPPAVYSAANFEQAFREMPPSDIVDQMMKVDRTYDLMGLNLCYTDRMSMAVGLETRVPFLDFDVVRVMANIPAGLKIRGRHQKYVLKKAAERFLPHEVIYREKAGFGLPIRAWLQRSNMLLSDYLSRDRLKRQGLFNPDAVERILLEQRMGTADHANTIMTLLFQQIWLDNFL